MARPYRVQGKDCIYHITSRGNERRAIFHFEKDFLKFLGYLKKAKEKFKFYLYAYCLMKNHYHLFLETTLPNLSRIMQYINTSYTVYHNVKYEKCGHLFQGRYRSILVEADSYFQELSRYIHLNPVNAKVVSLPGEYKWSSYNEWIGEMDTGLIDMKEMERYLKISRADYEKFVIEGIGEAGRSPLDSLYAGFILGSEQFIKDTISNIGTELEDKDISYKMDLQALDPIKVREMVARFYGSETDILCGSDDRSMLAKKVAIYLLKRLTAMTNREIGDQFGISYSAVSKVAGGVDRLMEEDRGFRGGVERIISHFKV
ncbi:MAG: transposase [Candidatus Omnitrophica bacterium]|nr:transposase [Candidatus Omnitrophota bacterium]